MKFCPKLLRTYFRRCGDRYPRFVSILFGIILPLLILDVVSILIGRCISTLESPLEIINNDAILAKTAYLNFIAALLANITSITPSVCLKFYLSNTTKESINDVLSDLNHDFVDDGAIALENFQLGYSSREVNEIVEVNTTDVLLFMLECGDHFRQTISGILSESLQESSFSGSDLTFGWNRCSSYKGNLTTASAYSQSTYEQSLRPVSQTAAGTIFSYFFLSAYTHHGD